MDYEVLNLHQASELKRRGKLLMAVDFNYAKVYLLNDSSYLVIPFFPFGHSIHILHKNLLDKFIIEKHFPVDEETNKFYIENRKYLDDLTKYKEQLKVELTKYIFKTENYFLDPLLPDQIDQVYEILKKKRKLKKYKLNFIILLGDYLIKKHEIRNLKWGLLSSKRLLNPSISLILIDSEKDGTYFNIQEYVIGKWSYLGMQIIVEGIENNLSKNDEFDTIVKVM